MIERPVCLQKIRIPPGGRLLVVGDTHGHRRELSTLMAATGFQARRDQLIFCGDLIDRGPDSPGVVQMLGFEWACSVLGNHEYVARRALDGETEASVTWGLSGGLWGDLLSMRERDQLLAILSRLPDGLLIEVDGLRIGVVHAGYPNHLQFERDFLHVRREALIYGSPPAECPSDLDLLLIGHRQREPEDPAIVCLNPGPVSGVILGLDVGRSLQCRVSGSMMAAKVNTRLLNHVLKRRDRAMRDRIEPVY